MRKLVMSMVLMMGLAFSAQAVQFHNFNLAGQPGGWDDLTSYVNTHLNGVLGNPDPLIEFGYLGKLEFVKNGPSNGTINGLTVTGLGNTSGTWSYDGIDSIVAIVLKGGNMGGWLVYNDSQLPNSLLPLGSAGDWMMQLNNQDKRQDLSFFAAFTGPGEPSQRVPEPGTTLASLLVGLGFLTVARRKLLA